MAVLYIAEATRVAIDADGKAVQALDTPFLATQNPAIGGTSVQSNAFNAKTRFIEVHTDAICSIAIGADPTAVATAGRMAAGETRIYGVNPGHKIAVITNT